MKGTYLGVHAGLRLAPPQGLQPPPPPPGSTNIFPVGSAYVTGLLLAYAYPFICCGSSPFSTGSADRKRPAAGSYSRAPRFVRPVVPSTVPPTNPRSPGQDGGSGARSAPKGRNRRSATAWLEASTERVAVPCGSGISHFTPLGVRAATMPPLWR